jgi:hypothetical protein
MRPVFSPRAHPPSPGSSVHPGEQDFLIFSFVIMPDHIHFLCYPRESRLTDTLRDFKSKRAPSPSESHALSRTPSGALLRCHLPQGQGLLGKDGLHSPKSGSGRSGKQKIGFGLVRHLPRTLFCGRIQSNWRRMWIRCFGLLLGGERTPAGLEDSPCATGAYNSHCSSAYLE